MLKISQAQLDSFADEVSQIAQIANIARTKANFTVAKKTDGSPVTVVDTTVQAAIIPLIRKYLGATLPILAEEESEELLIDTTVARDTYATLDPVDGTSPLASGDSDSWNVALSLVINGRPMYAIIARPSHGDVIVATESALYLRDKFGNSTSITPVHNPHKMWAMDMTSDVAKDLIMAMFNLRLVADRDIGGYPSNVPSIESGLRVILGTRKYFVTGTAKMWDIAPIAACMQHLPGYSITNLYTGDELNWHTPHRDKLPLLAVMDSPQWRSTLLTTFDQVRRSVKATSTDFRNVLSKIIGG